jgi:two-component system, response regulator PdtaR
VHSTKQHTILVVEDEILIRLMTAEALREAGFGVVEAGTADEALAILKKNAPVDLVFADVRMPGTMDGIALAGLLRKTRPDLKIVFASGYAPDWPSPNLADAFFGKPYDLVRAVKQIKTLLECE